MGRTTKTISPDGTFTTERYDAAGNLIYSTDAMGRVTQFVYDSRNRRIATIRPNGSVLLTEYDGGGRIVGQTNALGNTTHDVYDKLGRKTEEIQPDPAASTAANTGVYLGTSPSGASAHGLASTDSGRRRELRDAPRIQLSCSIPPMQLGLSRPVAPIALTASPPTGDDVARNNAAAPDGTQVALLKKGTGSFWQSISFSAAGAYTIGFQAAYRPNCAGPDTFTVQIDGQTVGTFTPTTYATYQGYLVSFAIATGGNHTVSFVGLDSSDADQTTFIDGVGSRATTQPATTTTLTTYDDVTDKRYVTDGLGSGSTDIDHTTETDYDKLGRVIKVIEPAPAMQARPATIDKYDANGNLKTVTDPAGSRPATITTRAIGRSARRMYTVGDCTWYYYNADSNLQYVVDPNGADSEAPTEPFSSSPNDTTEYVYDNLDRKIEEIAPSSSTGEARPTTTYAFDASGNMVSTTDADGNVTSYCYNIEGRRTETIDALGDTTTTVYDAVGNVLSVADALGHTTSFVYDPMDQKDFPNLPSPSGRGAGGEGNFRPRSGLGRACRRPDHDLDLRQKRERHVRDRSPGQHDLDGVQYVQLAGFRDGRLGLGGRRPAAHDNHDLHSIGAGFHRDRSLGPDHRVPLRQPWPQGRRDRSGH